MIYSESIIATKKPNIVIGYTTRRHLILDFDNTRLSKLILLIKLILHDYPKLGDCIICLSSVGSYKQRIRYTRLGRPLVVRSLDNFHAIFDATIGYNSCCRIISMLAGLSILNRDYLKIREFRGDMTLRTSPMCGINGTKPMPQPICYLQTKHPYKRGGNIDKYLSMLKNCYAMAKGEDVVFSPLQLYQRHPLLRNLLPSRLA